MTEWQPIETAPEPYGPNALFFDGQEIFAGRRTEDGWTDVGHCDPARYPTRWMPLPDLPLSPVAQERAAIVAWLRSDHASLIFNTHRACMEDGANAIERGEHIVEKPT